MRARTISVLGATFVVFLSCACGETPEGQGDPLWTGDLLNTLGERVPEADGLVRTLRVFVQSHSACQIDEEYRFGEAYRSRLTFGTQTPIPADYSSRCLGEVRITRYEPDKGPMIVFTLQGIANGVGRSPAREWEVVLVFTSDGWRYMPPVDPQERLDAIT